MTSYDKFLMLCKNAGVTASYAMLHAGLSKSLATKWKKTPYFNPNMDSLTKLGRYFNVPIDYFLNEDADPYYMYNDTPETAMMIKGMRNMTPQQRTEILRYAKYVAPDAFNA